MASARTSDPAVRRGLRRGRPTLAAASVAAAVALTASACGGGDDVATTTAEPGTAITAEAPPQDRPDNGVLVVATTTILGDVVESTVGDAGIVETLMAPGQDPHSFEASARQAADLRDADLVIANGLGLEQGLVAALEAAEAEGARVIFIAEEASPIPLKGDDVHAADEETDGESGEAGDHDRINGALDPHFWMDPLRMSAAVRLIGTELAEASDVLTPAEWADRAQAYADQIEQVDGQIVSLLEQVPEENRRLVGNHDAFGYLEDRYGYEVIGVIVPGGSTLAEPSARELERLIETIKHEQIPAIFAETTQPEALAEVVADEAGFEVTVVELYTGSLGEEGSGAETYIGMIETNAERIAAALAE